MRHANTRDLLLDAADRLVAREGVGGLTIGRVAEEAGISRGGIFYHFASKEALVQGMVSRMVERFAAALDWMMQADPDPRARFTRAYIKLTLGLGGQEAAEIGAVMSGLLAGLAYDAKLLDPLNEQALAWQRRTESEVDPSSAAIVRLTAHALWTNGLLIKNDIDETLLATVVAKLEALAIASAEQQAGT